MSSEPSWRSSAFFFNAPPSNADATAPDMRKATGNSSNTMTMTIAPTTPCSVVPLQRTREASDDTEVGRAIGPGLDLDQTAKGERADADR
jgi:hypothetical protein